MEKEICPICAENGIMELREVTMEETEGKVVKTYSPCGHKSVMVTVRDKISLTDDVKTNKIVTVSDNVYLEDSALVFNPKGSLLKAIEEKEWFKGIVLSALYIEHFGKQKLTEHFRGEISSDKLKNLDLNTIIILLFASRIIDQPIYTKMVEIKDKRNDIIHNVWEKLSINTNEAENLIKRGVECLEKLGVL